MTTTIDQTASVTINAGHGSKAIKKTPTLGKTINGYFEIQSPDNGTWTLTAKDGNKVLKSFSGCVKGTQYSFSFKTGIFDVIDLIVDADWSEKADTTLVVHVHATA